MIVLPFLVMIIIGATFGAAPRAVPLALVDQDASPAAARVREALERSPALSVQVQRSETDLTQQVRAQATPGGVIIPAGFGAAAEGGQGGQLRLVLDLTNPSAQSLNTVVQAALAREGTVLAATRFAAEQAGTPPADVRALADRVPPVPVRVEATGSAREGDQWDNPYAYTAVSNLVLFVFVSTLAGAATLVEARQAGVTRRMLAGPVTTRSVIIGVGASRLLVTLLQSLLILGVGSLVFGVRWGDPVGVALVVTAFAVLATGVAMLVGSLARSPEQTQSIGVPVAIGLGMLGGCMWPLEIVPAPLRALGHLTPHAWAMDAWIKLTFEGGGPSAVALDVGVLGATALVLVTLAARALRRSLRAA
jgi:ABC-2 type transport system permease protein